MLIEALILQMCAGLVGQEHAACVSSLTAASIQADIKPHVDRAEAKTQELVVKEVTNVTGKEPLAATLYVLKVARDKEIKLRLIRNRGITPSVSTTASPNSGRIDFGWSF